MFLKRLWQRYFALRFVRLSKALPTIRKKECLVKNRQKKESHSDSSLQWEGEPQSIESWRGGGRHPDRAADTKRHQTEIRVQVFHDGGGGGGGTKGWVVNGLADEKRRLCHLACICINYSFDLYRLTGVFESARWPRRAFITISDPAAHLDKYPRPSPPRNNATTPVSCWSVERTLYISVCLQTALSNWSNVLHILFASVDWGRSV